MSDESGYLDSNWDTNSIGCSNGQDRYLSGSLLEPAECFDYRSEYHREIELHSETMEICERYRICLSVLLRVVKKAEEYENDYILGVIMDALDLSDLNNV